MNENLIKHSKVLSVEISAKLINSMNYTKMHTRQSTQGCLANN